ncbi:hypothetical protein DFH08DRAFT_217906 [Mycena albidolilacea]|uniref:Uncharacterized protein n=1 Tax=Mycena albidolilacea TaxID=1033008 RepID=A0AAD7ENH7_9AGAR|nr:hypothetical protein DFH08DRAFT_217906 [Mycena albidolilacea]
MVAVHSFDREAKPSVKGAAAGNARNQLTSVKNDSRRGARELTIQTGKSSVVPTITVDDIEGANAADAPEYHDDTPQLPGTIVAASGAIPDWYGWRHASGIDAASLAEGEEPDKGVLDIFLAD